MDISNVMDDDALTRRSSSFKFAATCQSRELASHQGGERGGVFETAKGEVRFSNASVVPRYLGITAAHVAPAIVEIAARLDLVWKMLVCLCSKLISSRNFYAMSCAVFGLRHDGFRGNSLRELRGTSSASAGSKLSDVPNDLFDTKFCRFGGMERADLMLVRAGIIFHTPIYIADT